MAQSPYCTNFLHNRNINPITNRTLGPLSPRRKLLEYMCNPPNQFQNKCETFIQNNNRNPMTGRSIKADSQISKMLTKLCEQVPVQA
jgi:hypothetical protein